MGRELKRKQSKVDKKITKEKVNTKEKEENAYSDIYKMLKMFGIILGIILVVYFFIGLLITKEIDWFMKNEDDTEVNTVTNRILAKNTFNQSEEEYYVYFYDFDNEDSDITFLISNKLTDFKVYKVDTGDDFNSNYVTTDEFGNSNAKSIDELKVVDQTLIKVSGDTIVSYVESTDKIKESINN